MSDTNEQTNTIDATSANIESNGNVEFVGGNQYKFGDNVINVDIAAPTYGTSIEQLQKALESNRKSLREDLRELEDLVRKELDLQDGRVQAVVKDIITGSKNIELLIPAIKLNGGSAKSQPFESNTIVTINTAIAKGQKESKARRKGELEFELTERKKALKKANRFKIFRTEKQKSSDVENATNDKLRTELELKLVNRFLEKTKDL